MSEPWLYVVGIGEDGPAALGAEARAAMGRAELFIGGARHLAMLGDDPRPRMPWQVPLDPSIEHLASLRRHRVVVLASGDPLWFGVARRLVARFGEDAIRVVPQVASMQLACARLRWSLAEAEVVTIHGRPLERLVRWLQPGRRLVILCADRHCPAKIANLLAEHGFGSARLHVLEHLGGPDERVLDLPAAEVAQHMFRDLVVVGLEVPAPAGPVRPLVPGLPDDAFRHDGQLTKREVRAATLAKLAPCPRELLWDVGAGSGAIGIEWLRAQPGTRAIAIERNAGRLERIRANALQLGTPELATVLGSAPAALDGLPRPDAIFLGGGTGTPGLIAALAERLRPGGRLVANAVTLEGEAALLAAASHHGGELARIAVSRAEPVGGMLAWRALAPVTQWAWTRP
ncbi:MAG TPA: precorrin-6y C5,15-methyltransferase (decarboxylating) subunit CbiE [Geminicoccus sp.]|uniref:precorrin-6y C5,15-methyltransferase (decarboxylating) subunit CbiE n=1 Tax=Geminicoccus sp. TaxID=2024832 RepID=UPI002C75F830|nr:precorrin-6y C5,15-methyltransferase (decarboxylating) subunit CbiE [Geminicoccus sp.]HWL67238.1 precorrin-6y C5,15-methyltransferase (decarboxylating) subunit CbiE [Geminicoccus sp.]